MVAWKRDLSDRLSMSTPARDLQWPLLSRHRPRASRRAANGGGLMSETTDIVDAQIEAYRAKDLERFLSYYSDDASVIALDGSPMFVDKAAMREQYGKLFTDSPDLELIIANRVFAGEFVVDEEHVTGLHFEGMPTALTGVVVYKVTGGMIAQAMLLL